MEEIRDFMEAEVGSGYVNTGFFKTANTVTSSHVKDGECKIVLLNQ